MTRSILIGSLIGILGIGGSAIAADGFTPRPVQSASTARPELGNGVRPVDATPGVKNKRGPPGAGAELPNAAKRAKGTMVWPEGTPDRLRIMYGKQVEEQGLSPVQAKALQTRMLEKGEAFKAQKTQGKAKGPAAGKGQGKVPPKAAQAQGGRTPPRQPPAAVVDGDRAGAPAGVRAYKEANGIGQ